MNRMRWSTAVVVLLSALGGCGDGFEAESGASRGIPAGTGGDDGGAGGGESATAGEGGASSGSSTSSVPPQAWFVNPVSGDDAAEGTALAPYRTMKQALSVATFGQTIWLLPGTYGTASGEDWESHIPPGVTLSAVVKDLAVLVGDGTEKPALVFNGDGAARYLRIEGFGLAISAATGVQSLEDLTLVDNAIGLGVAGDARAVASRIDIRGGVTGFFATDDAHVEILDSSIHHLGTHCDGLPSLGNAVGSAQVIVDHLDAAFVGGPLLAGGTASLMLSNSTLVDVGAGCSPGASITATEAATVIVRSTVVQDPPAEAIHAEGIATLTLLLSSLGGCPSGDFPVAVFQGTAATIDTVSMTATGEVGLLLEQGATLHASHFTIWGGDACLRSDASTLSMRLSKLAQCTMGILATGPSELDLGTAEDLGGNTFTAVGGTVLRLEGPEVETVEAAGNLWIPKVQGSGPLGLYQLGTTKQGPFGCNDPEPRNFCSEAASIDL